MDTLATAPVDRSTDSLIIPRFWTIRRFQKAMALAAAMAFIAQTTFSIALAGDESEQITPAEPRECVESSEACALGFRLAEDDAQILLGGDDPGTVSPHDVSESLRSVGLGRSDLCAKLWDHAQWWSGYAHAMFDAYKITAEPQLLKLSQHAVNMSNTLAQTRVDIGCKD